MARNDNFFNRLTRLFRSGPAIQRKVKGYNYNNYFDNDIIRGNYGYRAPFPFGRESSPFSVLGAYGLLDRMSRYAEFCFSADTCVYTLDGVYTIKELAEKYPNGENIKVYSYDHSKNEIVVATAHHPRITKDGKVQKLVQITFEDGGKVKTTLDHKFLLRAGEYVEAKDLIVGQALMPFYVKDITASGYKHIYTINKKEHNPYGWTAEHILVAEHFLGRKLNPQEVVHHVDFNPSNNLPSNLKVMTEVEHRHYHSLLNNNNKKGKSNKKHSVWMQNNNPVKRQEITALKIFETASAVDFSLAKTKRLLKADVNLLKRRLREIGYENWLDFKADKDKLTTIRNAAQIYEEMQSPEIEDIIKTSEEHECQSIYRLASILKCTENSIRRRLSAHGYGSWSEFMEKNPKRTRDSYSTDNSVSYQQICDIYDPVMSAEMLAEQLNTSINKIKTCIERQGFNSFGDWKLSYTNHKIASIEFLQEEEVVYNITVDEHHNLAVGSKLLNPITNDSGSTTRTHSMVICRQSEMEYCLVGDTKIAVPGGYKTIKELADEYGLEKEFIVYSYDHNKNQIVPAIGKQARQTRVDDAYRVVFDSGKEIIGTANHRLLKRDGTYCEIRDLKPGDAMMPFYRKDLFSEAKSDEGDGYRWIYTMNKSDSTLKNGWVSEHRLIASWIAGRDLQKDEVVHHCNFVKFDNRPENLQIMTESEHASYHSTLNNEKKWNDNNQEWINEFKKRHSDWMTKNNPAERKDITFDRILNWCLENSFNIYRVCKAFDTDPNVIKRKLRAKGFDNFVMFAQAYKPGWRSDSWNNSGNKNPRFNSKITFNRICSNFEKGISQETLATRLGCSITPITNRLKDEGFNSWSDFVNNYENHKVVSVEYYGTIPLYDLTVDGYKNFATDSVISHNTPEIAAALNIYADECTTGDERGKTFHILSSNPQIKKSLDELFYDILNIEFNLRPWIRNLVKYGDLFLYNEVIPDIGVVNVQPIRVNELEREEGWDPNDPYAVRFKWLTRGNRYLENWQVTHMRILGNDMFLPYGTSILEPARRIWRQLCHAKGTRVWTKSGWENIEDIKPGQEVFSYDFDHNITIPTKVKAVYPMGKQEILKIKTNHRTINVTPNHGLLVKEENGNIGYKMAKNLVIDKDQLVLPRLPEDRNGFYTNSKKSNRTKHFISLNKKRIPGWIFRSSTEQRLMYLQKISEFYHSEKDNEIILTNLKLIKDIKTLAEMSGVVVSSDIEKIYKTHKKSLFKININLNSQISQNVYEKVISTTKWKNQEQTYDLQVENPLHNFIAEGIVTHNTMMEDSMLVYRVVRSPERRVFYIDVGNIAPNDIPSYMEQAKQTLRARDVVSRQDGRVDQRYNPLSVDDDYFIPVRGGQTGTKIETLAGGQNATATEDVEYLQKKLFAAIQVPKPYLNFTEGMSAKASLAQQDVRFSRTIIALQKIAIAELNKLAMIHLYSKGFNEEDLLDFHLKLANPSTIALLQKLENLASKFDIAAKAKETKLVDELWIQKNIIELSDDELMNIEKGRREDKIREVEIESIAVSANPDPGPTRMVSPFDNSNYEIPGEDVSRVKPSKEDDFFQKMDDYSQIQNYKKEQEEETFARPDVDGTSPPVQATPFVKRTEKNRLRRVGAGGKSNLEMPDFGAMFDRKNVSLTDIYDKKFLDNPLIERVLEEELNLNANNFIPRDFVSTLDKLKIFLEQNRVKTKMVLEENEQIEIKMNNDELLIESVDRGNESSDENEKVDISEIDLSRID